MDNLILKPQFSPISIARALWKHKLFIGAMTLLGTLGTAAIVYRLPPVYTANAVVLVESQKIPETFVAATVQTALEAQLDTLKHQVLSRDRLWGLVESFHLYAAERQTRTKEEVLELMRDDLNISLSRGWSTRGPGAFQVEFRANTPQAAADVANQIGMFFINENLRERAHEAVETSHFLDEQLDGAENRLRDQESRLTEFKLQHNGELPEQEAALLSAVNQSRAELLGIQEGLGRAQQNKLILESSLAYAQANLRDRRQLALRRFETDSPRILEPQSQPEQPTTLQRAEFELRRLQRRYYDSHPDVQRMREEVQRLRRDEVEKRAAAKALAAAETHEEASNTAHPADTARTSAVAPDTATLPVRPAEEDFSAESSRIQELTAQITAIEGEIRNLEQRRTNILMEVAENQQKLHNLPIREQQIAGITRDYDTSKVNYQNLLNKKLAADVATDMERWQKSEKFVMLDYARPPQKPTKPKRRLLTVVGAILSFGLGVSLGFLLELKRNTILGEWELPSDILVVGRIPVMNLKNL